MYTSDLPFSIKDVCHLLGLTIRRERDNKIDVDCPFCYPYNGKKGKMNLNLDKDAYWCYRCQSNGGRLGLYAAVKNVTTAEARKEILDQLHINPDDLPEPQPYKRIKKTDISKYDLPRRVVMHRHIVYQNLFDILTLSKFHAKKLQARGLPQYISQEKKYRSTPVEDKHDEIIGLLLDKGLNLKGVPGFYTEDSQWRMCFYPNCSGIIIPICNVYGHIQALQIRLDAPFADGTKYLWFSSADRESGKSSSGPAHFAGHLNTKTIYITEGGLKGDIANYFTGRPFLCIAGASQYQSLVPYFRYFKKIGIERIVECLDMDKLTNENVEKGCLKVLTMAKKYGFQAEHMVWDENYKGIDDYAYHLFKEEKRTCQCLLL